LPEDIRNGLKDQATSIVYEGADAVTQVRVQTLADAKFSINICDDSVGTVALVQFEPVYSTLRTAAEIRHLPIRFITDICKENLAACKQIARFAELRHLEGVKGNFVVTDSSYYAFAEIKESKIPVQAIHSRAKIIVEQQKYLFDTLWNSAIPAKIKIRELEEGIAPVETKIIKGRNEIQSSAFALIDRSISSHLYIAIDNRATEDPEAGLHYVKKLMARKQPFEFLIIADIQTQNLDYYKMLLREGVQIRHIGRNRVTFLLSGSEYLSGQPSVVRDSPNDRSEATWTNNLDVVGQMNQIFETMWHSAVLAEARVRQLEEGIEPQETRVIEDFSEVLRIGQKMTHELKREALIIAASENTILRNTSLYQVLSQKQEKLGFRVRVLCPSISTKVRDVLPNAEWRRVDPTSVSVTIYDGERMFITQYADPRAPTSEKAVASNIYSTNKQTILGMVSVFETLWRESELRDSEEKSKRKLAETLEKEERSRRQAQLLQDILTHDIRNYNQVSKLSAELLKEKFASDPEVQTLVDSLLQAIDGSTSLVERGRRLGRILTEEDVQLYPINLVDSLRRSLSLLKLGNKGRLIEDQVVLPKSTKENTIRVLADDLIDEVFSNILTNSLKYTEGPKVLLKIDVRDEDEHWKVSISDRGTGIPNEMLPKVFDRYLAGAKGSGLGMSIVHALVVQRYHGGLEINSSQDPKSHGTTIHIWLRKG
jgi:two-component system, OmpR family, sensor histidine kinase VicK